MSDFSCQPLDVFLRWSFLRDVVGSLLHMIHKCPQYPMPRRFSTRWMWQLGCLLDHAVFKLCRICRRIKKTPSTSGTETDVGKYMVSRNCCKDSIHQKFHLSRDQLTTVDYRRILCLSCRKCLFPWGCHACHWNAAQPSLEDGDGRLEPQASWQRNVSCKGSFDS